MPKFFRRIRLRLLFNKQLQKYLLYATGEILLVMIGILLALQVNNWNTNRNQQRLEKKLLKEMLGNLKQDLSDIESNLETCGRLLRSNRIVLNHLDLKLPYHDSLEYHYSNLWGNTIFIKNTSAFENLESLGFNIVSTDSLRMKITNLYSGKYNYAKVVEDLDNKYQFEQLQPSLRKYIRTDVLWSKAYPIAPEALMENQDFKEVIRFNITTREFVINIYQGLEIEIRDLMKSIQAEFDK